jgi:hypothetical protein
LFDVTPALLAHDLHPDYLSTAYALEQVGVETVAVQHHHAHIASCLADNGVAGPVIGLALDGTGFGPDGTLWGGEVLVADLTGYRRAGHLAPVPLPAGPRRSESRGGWPRPTSAPMRTLRCRYAGGTPSTGRPWSRWAPGRPGPPAQAGCSTPSPRWPGVRDRISYEGQAAIELEQRVDLAETGGYEAAVADGVLSGADLVRAAADDVLRGVPTGTVAARFHRGLAAGLVALIDRARQESGLGTVALSGGVLQNVVLQTLLTDRLAAGGFAVLTHSRVPPNDAGISLGQAVVAAARDRRPCHDGASTHLGAPVASWADVTDAISALPEVTEGERHGHRTWFVAARRSPGSARSARPTSGGSARRPRRRSRSWPSGSTTSARRRPCSRPGTPGSSPIPHFDGFAAVLIELDRAAPDTVRDALTDGYLACAPAPWPSASWTDVGLRELEAAADLGEARPPVAGRVDRDDVLLAPEDVEHRLGPLVVLADPYLQRLRRCRPPAAPACRRRRRRCRPPAGRDAMRL